MTTYYQGHPCCSCQAQWLPELQRLANEKGIVVGELPISQLIGGAAASGNTHLLGGASDFYPLSRITAVGAFVRLCRDMGADGTWYRPFNWDGRSGVAHVHSVLTGCPHCATTAAYQTAAVRRGFNGLGHNGEGARDSGPTPLSGRTWQEGLIWAREQEDDMPYTEQELTKIVGDAVTAATPKIVEAVLSAPINPGQTDEVSLRQAVNQTRNKVAKL